MEEDGEDEICSGAEEEGVAGVVKMGMELEGIAKEGKLDLSSLLHVGSLSLLKS